MTRSRSTALLAIVLSFVAICPKASAQDNAANAAARLLYDEARALLKAENYAEACPKLERSHAMSPATDTKFWLADCYEHTGRPTTAWQLFREAVDESKAQGNDKKASYARERAQALVPRLAKIKVSVPAEAVVEGLEIKCDGKVLAAALWDQEVPVDPGSHVISVAAPWKKGWEEPQKVDEGAAVVVTIPKLIDVPKPAVVVPPVAAKPSPPPVEPAGTRWAYLGPALGAAGVGVAGVVAGAVFGVGAMSQWKQGHDECGQDCPKDTAAYKLIVEADRNASASTVGFVVGGAALAASGVLLYLGLRSPPAARSSGLSITPTVGPEHAGVSLQATF